MPVSFPGLAALGLSVALLSAAPAAWSQASAPAQRPVPAATTGGAGWKSLTPSQRSALAPLERDWQTIAPDQQQKWLEVAARFPKMPAAEQQRIQARMSEWAKLSPKERGEARMHYQEVRQLSPAERQARWEQYQALPADQRRELAARSGPQAAASAASGAHTGRPTASAPSTRKSNIVAATPAMPTAVKPVAPTVVQAKPGATTTLMSRQPAPPAHQQPGLPKVAASPGFVDHATLLPQRGAQAAATRAASGASAPARQ
jgi:hypothetical protein